MPKRVVLRGGGLRPIACVIANRGKTYRLVSDVPQTIPDEVVKKLKQLPDLKFDISTPEGGDS